MSITRRKKKSLLIDDLPPSIKKIILPDSQVQYEGQSAPAAVVPVNPEPKPVVSESVAPKPATARTAAIPGGGMRPQSISITKSKAVSYQNGVSDSDSNVLHEPVAHNAAFSDDDFWAAWSAFQNTLSDEDKVGFLNLNLPARKSDSGFELVVNNPMQENEAKRLLTNAIQFLRTKLNNTSVTIQTRVAEESEVHRSKSPEELYMDMIARNPQLEQFRKLLNLEID